jgi:hemoglobin-like flavoprotein
MAYKEIIEQRLNFLGFDKQTLATLKKIKPIIEPSMDHILDKFYEQMSHEPEMMALFPTEKSKAAARRAQKAHWIDILFSGDIGKAHFENAERIGKTHERIGLSLGNYLAGYSIILNQFVRVISDHFHDDNISLTRKIQALNKAVFLDIDSVIDSYLEAKDKAIQMVLIHAEQFTASLKKTNLTVAKQANEHQKHLAGILKKDDAVDQRVLELEQKISGIKQQESNNSVALNQELKSLLEESLTLLKTRRDIHGQFNKAEQHAIQLADQINGLNSQYEKLQDEHKCHFTEHPEQPLFQKVKLFFASH